jgi:hypothetical protein
MRKQKAIDEIDEWRANPQKVRFERLCTIAEVFGFRFSRQSGSHKVYVRDEVEEILNFQDVGGKAKPYQVKQFIDILEKYNLLEADDDV